MEYHKDYEISTINKISTEKGTFYLQKKHTTKSSYMKWLGHFSRTNKFLT